MPNVSSQVYELPASQKKAPQPKESKIKVAYDSRGSSLASYSGMKEVKSIDPTTGRTVATYVQSSDPNLVAKNPYQPTISANAPYYFVHRAYYLLEHGGKIYFQKANIWDGQPTILAKPHKGHCGTGVGIISQIPDPKAEVIAYLTRKELDDIVKNKPTVDALFSVYRQFAQPMDGIVMMEISTAIPIW